VHKYFSGAVKMFSNTSQASPAPKRYQISIGLYIEILLRRRRSIKYTSPAPNEPGKYLKTPFRRRRSAYIHLSGAGEAGEAGEVFMYTA